MRELKHNQNQKITFFFLSHLYGCVNWNSVRLLGIHSSKSRTFTGAWIETRYTNSQYHTLYVAPLRVRELKLILTRQSFWFFRRTFTGAWIETDIIKVCYPEIVVAPLRVRELKLIWLVSPSRLSRSHLYGCVNWNIFNCFFHKKPPCRTFTGAWIETGRSL
mgnify:CR=1 FL=1